MDFEVLNYIPQPVLLIDRDYKVLFANTQAKEVYGEEGLHCYQLTHSFEKPCYEYEGHPCPIRIIKGEEKESSYVVHIHKTKEGGERFFYVIGSKISQDLYLEVHIDLQRLAQSFEFSRVRPELLISSGPLVFFHWKRAEGWPVELVSPNVHELLGYTAEEFMSGKVSYAELIHPEDLQRVAQEVDYHTKNRSKSWTHQDYRVIRKDGRVIWLLDYTVPVLDEKGEVVGYYGYVMDITEKHEQEELFYVLAENNPNGVVLYDYEEDKVLYANSPLLELLGYEREEVVGKSYLSFVCEEDRQTVMNAIKKRRQGSKEVFSYTVKVCAKGGKV
mgnify:CR=1 FL=1